MDSYLDVIKAIANGEIVQVQGVDAPFNRVMRYIADETYEPRHFRIKPKPSWEEELWLKFRKDSTISFNEVSEFVEALKLELRKVPDDEGWIIVPKDWDKSECPVDIDPNTKIEVEYRREGYDIDRLCNFCEDSWDQEDDRGDIIRFRVI